MITNNLRPTSCKSSKYYIINIFKEIKSIDNSDNYAPSIYFYKFKIQKVLTYANTKIKYYNKKYLKTIKLYNTYRNNIAISSELMLFNINKINHIDHIERTHDFIKHFLEKQNNSYNKYKYRAYVECENNCEICNTLNERRIKYIKIKKNIQIMLLCITIPIWVPLLPCISLYHKLKKMN